jgi:hypothetical protein
VLSRREEEPMDAAGVTISVIAIVMVAAIALRVWGKR